MVHNFRHLSDTNSTNRVRTILVLGYWVLGNIDILGSIVIGGYFLLFWHPMQYQSDSSQHCPHASEQLFSSACYVTCILTAAIVWLNTMLICCCLLNTIVVIIIEFWDFSWSLLYYILVSILVLGIGIARGQYYWVLDIGCLAWYRSNPTRNNTLVSNYISLMPRPSWCLCLALRTHSGACQKWMNEWMNEWMSLPCISNV